MSTLANESIFETFYEEALDELGINKEALLDNIYDEVWEEFRIQLGLTDDQMYAKEQNGYYTFLERETYKRYEDLSN